MIVTFIDPLCTDICPLEAQVVDQSVQRRPLSQRPVILAVSVNPYGNARSTLLKDERKWHIAGPWRWVIGSHSQLAAVWKRYRIAVSITRKRVGDHVDTSVSHTVATFIVDPTGHERALFIWPFYPQDVEQVLRRLSL